MNKAMIIGGLTKDPELRKTASDISVCTFTVAVSRQFNRDETDFIQVVVWRKLAELCDQYLEKGKKVAVFGRIQTRSYEGNDGQRRYVTELIADDVEFLPPRGEPDFKKSDFDLSNFPGTRGKDGLLEEEQQSIDSLDDSQFPF